MNIVLLSGTLVKDCELMQSSKNDGKATRLYTLGTIVAKDQDGKEDQFLKFVAFESAAKFITTYLKKGSTLEILGKMNSYQSKDEAGNYKTDVKVLVSKVRCLDKKGASLSDNPNNIANQNEIPQAPRQPQQDVFETDNTFNISSEDLPF